MSNKEISWEMSATVNPTKLKRRTRANAPTNFPIFGEASKVTEDHEWITFLNKAEKGQFPSGFSYEKETMFFNRNRNSEGNSKKIGSIDSGEFFLELKDFMNQNGFLTKLDKIPAMEEIKRVNGDSWKEMPPKYKQAVIGKFMESEMKVKNLSDEETTNLLSTIRMGFLIGIFDKESVEVQNFTIKEIKGLLYDPKKNKNKYYLDTSIDPVIKYTPKQKINAKPKKTYVDYWRIFNDGNACSNFNENRQTVDPSVQKDVEKIPEPLSEDIFSDNSATDAQ
jgi:hypothetical protein